MRLANKVAVVTGGSTGIGFATAQLFVAEGAKVAIIGRNKAALDDAAAKLGANALPLRGDVTDPAGLETAMAATVARFGKIDVVFANAGVGGVTPLGKTAPATFEEIIRSNLSSVFFTVQAALPHLNAGAAIILNGSVHAEMGAPAWAAYAAAKGGVRAMTRVLASELAPQGVRVNQVTPGATRTQIWSFAAPDKAAFAALETSINRGTPLGRFLEPVEVAKAALYLASNDSVNVTGAEIVVDGGATGAPRGAPIYRAA